MPVTPLQPKRALHTPGNRRGAALVLVLWVLAFLTIVAAQFCRTMRTEADIAHNYREMTQAGYSARAGVQMALLALIRAVALPLPPQAPVASDENEVDWRLNIDIPATGPSRENIVVRIDNEGGKVNLNLAGPRLLRLAVSGLGLTEEEEKVIVDAIMDWRDKDSHQRPHGAENDYYMALPEPYPCKNGDFDHISELLLVRGVTPEVYYGGLADRVTVHPSRRTAETALGLTPGTNILVGGFDFNRININAAPPELLRQLPEFDDAMVAAIVAFRETQDIRADSELVALVGPRAFPPARSFLTFHASPYYTITAFGESEAGRVRQGLSTLVRVDLKSREKYYTLHWHSHIGTR